MADSAVKDNCLTDQKKIYGEYQGMLNSLLGDSVSPEMIKSIWKIIELLLKRNESLSNSCRELERATISLKEQIVSLNKIVFGPRSEKTKIISQNQRELFPRETAANGESGTDTHEDVSSKPVTVSEKKAGCNDADPKKGVVQVPAHERKPKRSQKEIYASLPSKTELISLSDAQRRRFDGMEIVRIGVEPIRTEIRHHPAVVERVNIQAEKYKVIDPQSGREYFVRADVPAPLIEHSFATASLVSHIIANKYLAGLPLYRQEQLFRYQDFSLSRGTMANLLITVSELYLKKIYLRLCRLIVEEKVIHADETPIQVLKEPARNPQQKSYMWVYTSSKRSERQIQCFVYEMSRAGICPHQFLSGFIGILISDGYSGYLKVEVIRAGCWAHMRRKWVEAIPTGVPGGTSIAETGLKFCDRLFEFERGIESLSDDERLCARNKTTGENEPRSAKEILKEYWEWVDSFTDKKLSGKLKKAFVYANNQREQLNEFLTHGEIEISNNRAENAIRPFVIGRKAWLFSDTVQGAEASAVMYSLIETAKANNLNPERWLEHVLSELPERFAYDPNDSIDDLLPWTKEMQAKFKLAKA